MHEQESTRPLPGIFATISAGFDLTAKHLWLLLIPVVFDVFYWLGPRLRFQTLIEQLLAVLPAEADGLDQITQLASIAPRTNLFTTLSVQLVGVPAYMVGPTPESTPIPTQIFELESWTSWFGLFILLSILGLLLTALFYTLIAFALSKQSEVTSQMAAGDWLKRVFLNWAGLIGLAVLFVLITLVLYTPLIIIGSILFLIHPALGTVAVMAGLFLIAWVVIVLSMAPFGIVLNRRPIFPAVMESIRLVQANLPAVIYLLFTILIIGTILDWLLFAVESGSWLTLVNIAGHAFVSTALVATVFVFYRDRYNLMFNPEAAIELQTLHGKE